MQTLSDDERKAILGEILADELKAIVEYVKDVPTALQRLEALAKDTAEVKADVKVVKAAVTDTSAQVHDHERRITHLEAA